MGRELTHTDEAVAQSDVVILAVRDVVLGNVSAGVVLMMKPGAILLNSVGAGGLGCASVTAPAETRHAKREFWTTAPDFS
jgi:hypothetical protein